MTQPQIPLFSRSGRKALEPSSAEHPLWNTIEEWVTKSDRLFVKKLSRNDTSWADNPRKYHQAGFYIPREVRQSEFFPALQPDNPAKPHIFHAACRVLWPQTGEITASHMRHFSNKGTESHVTGVARDLFRGLAPASLLLGGRLKEPISDARHWFVVLDSFREEAEILETALDLKSDFHFALFEPDALRKSATLERDEVAELIERLQSALKAGTLDKFLSEYARIPSPDSIATAARQEWLDVHDMKSLDPWKLAATGDAIMEISRDVEYRIFRRHELRRRAAQVVKVLAGEQDLITAVVRGFPDLDAVFLSASQQRKTRAGRSFEQHIAAVLRAGNIRFEEQAVTGGRRPDFVLPDVPTLRQGLDRPFEDALVLAAKTTLRERWKQVSREGFHCAVFLATVDDRVPETSIREMADQDIVLVVPESLKRSKETRYPNNNSVISFSDFFHEELREKRPVMLLDVGGAAYT